MSLRGALDLAEAVPANRGIASPQNKNAARNDIIEMLTSNIPNSN